MVYRILYVSRNVSNVKKRGTNLSNLIEAIEDKLINLNQIHFKNEYLGKPSGLA
jgi:hypothetical protein